MPAPWSQDVQRFDHEPSPTELTALLGKRHLSDALDVRDTKATFSIRHPRVPWKPTAIFLGVFVLALAYVPVFHPALLPVHFGEGAALGTLAAIALLIYPTIIGVLYALDRKAASTPPGVIVDKRAQTVTFPRAGITTRREAVTYVTELRRWDNESGENDKVTQWGVVFEQEGVWTHVPVGHDVGKRLGASPATALADVLGVRVKRTTLSREESRSADGG